MKGLQEKNILKNGYFRLLLVLMMCMTMAPLCFNLASAIDEPDEIAVNEHTVTGTPDPEDENSEAVLPQSPDDENNLNGDENESSEPEEGSGDGESEEVIDPEAGGEEETDEHISAPGSISGILWYSDDDCVTSISAHRFGEDDDLEPLADYTVYIYLPDDLITPMDSAQTAEDGSFSFDNLEPNEYILGLNTSFVDGVEYAVLPPEESAEADTMFEVNPGISPYEAFTEPLSVEPNMTIEVRGGLIRHVRTIDDFTLTARIDLSDFHNNTSGTGFVYSGYSYGYETYDSRFLYTDGSASWSGMGELRFTSAASGKVYHIIQSKSYTGGGSPYPNDPRYGTSVAKHILIDNNINVTLIVSDIDIHGCIVVGPGSSLTLILDNSRINAPANHIRQCIRVNSGSSITIESLSGSDADGRLTIDSTTLQSPGASDSNARIGGFNGVSGGNITINSGTIRIKTPSGNSLLSTGAAIGGGGVTSQYDYVGGSGGNITITGGIIDITASTAGAGIGGGGTCGNGVTSDAGNGGNINISGGTITITQTGRTTGGVIVGACIGGGGGISGASNQGKGGSGGNINISGGTINVTNKSQAAAIGAGTCGGVGTITISGGSVTAQSQTTVNNSSCGAAIGGCNGTNGADVGTITISGGTVNATSKYTAIGLVHNGLDMTNIGSGATLVINISGGDVYAVGGAGPGIGFWAACNILHNGADAINISGGNIIAKSDGFTVNNVFNVASGIGGNIAGSLPIMTLGPNANVRAYSRGVSDYNDSKPAFWVENNTGTGYYVNATFFNGAPSPSADLKLYVFEHGPTTNPLLKELTLPAGYRHFGYSTGTTSGRTDNVLAANGSTLRNVVRYSDRDVRIYAILRNPVNSDAYNSHQGYRNSLPVVFDGNGSFVLVTEKYVDQYGAALNPAIADVTVRWAANSTYAKNIPPVNGLSTKGYKPDTAPSGPNTYTPGTSISIAIGSTNKTIYFVYGPPTVDFIFTKVDKNDAPLQGVSFALYTCTNASSSHSHSRLVGPGSCWSNPVNATSAVNGKVTFGNLDPGHYMLVETATKPGYQLPFGQWYLEIDSSLNTRIEAHGVDSMNNPPAFKEALGGGLLLPNYRQTELPVSGGLGVILSTAMGAMLLASAAIFALLPKRRRAKQI